MGGIRSGGEAANATGRAPAQALSGFFAHAGAHVRVAACRRQVYLRSVTTSRLFRLAFAGIAGYFVLGIVVTLGAIRPLDVAGVAFVQQYVSPSWDRAFAVVAVLGSSEVVLVGAILLTGWLWLTGRRGLAVVVLAYLLMYPFELIGKLFLPQDPPGAELVREAYRYPLLHVSLGHSFPSGHACRFTFFALFAWVWLSAAPPVARWPLRCVIAVLAVPVLLSRIYIGAHWPSDVVGGMLLAVALLFGALGWYVLPALHPAWLSDEPVDAPE